MTISRAVATIGLGLLSVPVQPASDPRLNWMDRIAQQQLTERSSTIAGIRTRAGAEHRKQQVRATLVELIGGLPGRRGPLSARVTGQLANASYTLERVIFESLPRYYVTANVYRPSRPGRYPAVLLSAGHTMLGMTENHRLAANLAAKGFVALAYDPVGSASACKHSTAASADPLRAVAPTSTFTPAPKAC